MAHPLHTTWLRFLEDSRLHLSRADALMRLSLFGLLTGLLAGAVIVAFRLLVEGTLGESLPDGNPDNFEALPAWVRFALPLAGGVALALMFRFGSQGLHLLGVARVLERMAYHQGYLNLRGLLLQFFGAAIALISGHSVGREGPHVFLGAASASLLGQTLALPNNAIRTLVGCGTAAGIAASFNTPLAGVIFALEVIMLEYTLASFIPVIVAAVSATTLSVAVFGTDPAFKIPNLALATLAEIPAVILLGLLVGGVSAGFTQMLETTIGRTRSIAIWWKTIAAGAIVGFIALAFPQVMGIGYDTLNGVLLGQLGATTLAMLLVAKLLATTASIGLGVPGGTIGPSLFIGGLVGGLVGLGMQALLPSWQPDPGAYALLGMGAMMGANLQAPLAALTAMLELTDNPEIILPGMLVVVVAGLTASEGFRKESLFVTLLRSTGLDYDANPVLQALRRAAVGSVMERSFKRTQAEVTIEEAETMIREAPRWLLIMGKDGPSHLLPTRDLEKYLLAQKEQPAEERADTVKLLEIPGNRYRVSPVHLSATLQEALDLLKTSGHEALFVERVTAPGIRPIYGVLTREMLEATYKY
ncbi:MAG: chloride channel protein [Chromatiales bacterium]|nr:chloride channel protein [Chromatiales bacterium]